MSTYFHGLLASPSCNSCPLRYHVKVMPDGPVPAAIAIVGEGPGQAEEETGRGFVGPSGQMLWYLAERSTGGAFTRDQCWVSNAAICRPRPIRLTSGVLLPEQLVKAMSAQACRERLLRELLIVQPKVIVPVGNFALWALTDVPKMSIFDYRGGRLIAHLEEVLAAVINGTARAPIRQVQEK